MPLLYALLRGRCGEGQLLDVEGRSLRPFTLWQGFLLAWFCGIVWYFGTCYWIFNVMNLYGNLDAVVAALIMVAFCLLMGLHHGLFGMLVVLMARRSILGNRRPLLLAPFFWVAIELLRDRGIGDPWNPLGNSQVGNIPFGRIAEFTGVYGLSFAIVLVNAAFTAGLLLYGKRRINLLISAAAAAVALQMGILAKPPQIPATNSAVLLQQNVALDENWTPEFFDRTVAEFVQRSMDAVPQDKAQDKVQDKDKVGGNALIVWPESPTPFSFSDPKLRHWLSEMAKAGSAYLIVGGTATTEPQGPQAQGQPLNSALVVDPRGTAIGRYDKIHLVPFGEYVPFQNLLFFANKLTREVGNFAQGTERRVFDIGGIKTGVFICYESVFSDEVRQFAANGAQLFVNISNDGWYGETSAPFQHLDMTRMRAVENHRWILLSTNSGNTVAIDPLGRVVAQVPRNVRTVLTAPYAAETEVTFYSRHGDIFAWICVVISCIALFVRTRISASGLLEARST